MDLFLLHSLILIWASVGAARQLTRPTADRLLAAALLAGGNLVATSLLLSTIHQLGEPALFLGVSVGLALVVCLLLLRLGPGDPDGIADGVTTTGAHPWLKGAFIVTLIPLACASVVVAYTYGPNNPDSLAYHLPRAMFYLGQGDLAHFDAADPRQILLPFNYELVQLFALVYDAPLSCLNLFNLAAWALGGIAVHRLCRLWALGANASLITCWLGLVATPVIAQSASTTIDLPVAATVLSGCVFAWRWQLSHRTRDAVLAGLAVGLAAGADLRVLLLAVATGLLWLAGKYRHGWSPGRAGLRGWAVPVLLACAAALPFALINLAGNEPWIHRMFGRVLAGTFSDALHNAWSTFRPLWWRPPSEPPVDLNETIAGFGLAGGLFLFCAILCARRFRTPAGWFAWLGLAWIPASVLLRPRSSTSFSDFVPALLVLSPCVATMIDANRARPPARRFTAYAAVAVVVLATGWSATIYMLYNTSRPLAPVLTGDFVPPSVSPLPLLLDHHLSKQSRINIDTDGTNEAIFPLMVSRLGQRLTARHEIDPDAYNLLSRSSLSRNAACEDLARLPAYTLVPLPNKRTAGVEFLATLGKDTAARDYFGVEPHAGGIPPVDSSRFILITASADRRHPGDPQAIRLKVDGLNPADQTTLAVTRENIDRTEDPVATFTAAGEQILSIKRPFYSLNFKATDVTSGAEAGTGSILYLWTTTTALNPIDPAVPSSGRSLFVTDLVLSRQSNVSVSEGLLPTEGPFPQWDLPHIRWARRPSIVLSIPPVPGLAGLQLSFSVRLHTRSKGEVEVLFNGKSVRHCRIEGRTTWLDQTMELIPEPGRNVLEFRDVPLGNEPDWLDYLERYPDVKKHLITHEIPLESGAREHYETNGRAEGRILLMHGKPEPVPDSYYFMFRNIRLEGFRSP